MMRLIMAWALLLCVQTLAHAETNVLTETWNGMGVDDNKSVTTEIPFSKPAYKLLRKKEGAEVRIEQTVKLKPQTLYRFSATGGGEAKAVMRMRPSSSKDKEFSNLYKAWATGSAPMDEKLGTGELLFDSGLKADQASVSVYLDGKAPGAYTFNSIQLTEVGSSIPAADEKIILHLGDSITITSYLPFGQRVESLVAARIKDKFPAAKTRQINYGADGEYVKELLTSNRYEKIVKENLPRVDIVLIRYGANDHKGGSPDDFKKELATLCDNIQQDYPRATIILGTGTYLLNQPGVNKKYSPYWQAIRDLAKERKLALVDVYKAFETAKSDKLCRGAGDMHPSAEGVQLIASETFSALEELFK